MNITATDQFGYETYSVPVVQQIVKRSSTQEMLVGQQFFVLPLGKKDNLKLSLTLPGTNIYDEIAGANVTELLRISDSQSNFLVEKTLKLETQKCYPGFFFDGNACVCDSMSLGVEK